MREWVLEVEHIFDGSWASQAEEITHVEVARRFDAYLERLSCFVDAQERTEDEKFRLGHLLKVFTHVRPGLVQCYDIEGFPWTNNELERTIRAIKIQHRLISVLCLLLYDSPRYFLFSFTLAHQVDARTRLSQHRDLRSHERTRAQQPD
jgi:hypothetical protein